MSEGISDFVECSYKLEKMPLCPSRVQTFSGSSITAVD